MKDDQAIAIIAAILLGATSPSAKRTPEEAIAAAGTLLFLATRHVTLGPDEEEVVN